MPLARHRISTRAAPDEHARRTARMICLAGLVGATALPIVAWHRSIAAVASGFRVEFSYLLTGWLAYGLILVGLLFLVPVAVSVGRAPDDRLYPRSRNAYAGWGITCYLLGLALATQVAQIADGPGAG